MTDAPSPISRRLMLAAAAAPLLGIRPADAAAPFLNTNVPPGTGSSSAASRSRW